MTDNGKVGFSDFYTYNQFIYTLIENGYLTEAEPVAIIPADDEGGAVFLTGGGGEYVYQETSDFDGVVEDIPESLHVRPLSRFCKSVDELTESIRFVVSLYKPCTLTTPSLKLLNALICQY